MNLKLNKEFISYLKERNLSTESRARLLISSILFETASDNKDIFEGKNAIASFAEEILAEMIKEGLLSYSELTGYKLVFHTFEEQTKESAASDKFSWVGEFRDMFKRVNPDRWGTLSTCKERMKKFFSENPDVRKEDVLQATGLYLNNSDRRYIMKSHKFIFDGVGTSRNSTLEEWLEKLESIKNSQISSNQDVTDKLQ